jgi:hypothetical protein
MTLHLTKPNPELARLIEQTPEGMGTCSDPEARCGGCEYYESQHCLLYLKCTGRVVKKALPKETPACKYFENKQSLTKKIRASVSPPSSCTLFDGPTTETQDDRTPEN